MYILVSVAVTLGCLTEFEDKYLLLIPLQLWTQDMEELTRKPPLWGIALPVLEGAMQAAKREKRSAVLPTSNVYEPR